MRQAHFQSRTRGTEMTNQCRYARDYLDALRETAHILSGVLTEREILELLVNRTAGAMGSKKALVLLIAPDAGRMVTGGSMGLGADYLSAPETLSLDSGTNRKLLDGQVVIIPGDDAGNDPGISGSKPAGMVCVPLMVRGYIIGAVHVHVAADRMEEPDNLVYLNSLADLGALALERVRLQKSLYDIAAALNSSLKLQPMLQQVLEATVRQMWLKAASIRMFDTRKKVLRLVAVTGLSETYLNKGEVHPAKNEIDQRVLNGETVVVQDLETQKGLEYSEAALQEGIHSMLVVPLRMKGRVVGVMRVYSARPRRFAEVSQNFLKSVADLVGLAIENAELYGALEGRYHNLKVDLADWYRFLALG